MGGSDHLREKLSAVVVSYNRAPLIGTCLRSLGFADEVIVIDKSSTDGACEIAMRHADRVITVPWSPTVEETRAFAVAQCTHDWIIYLDDDECLSADAVRFIQAEMVAPRADVYGLLMRHYICGVHDEGAYYWPEHQIRMFRRGAVTFNATVHNGIVLQSDRVLQVAADTGIAIHNLSHEDVAQWIEKTNRYTSRVDRQRVSDYGQNLGRFAHDRIDYWLSRTHNASPGGYPEAVAVLRALYDLVDRLKTWEEERGLAGADEFQRICSALDAEYGMLGLVRDRAGETMAITPPPQGAVDERDVLRERLIAFRAHHDALVAERDALLAQRDARAAESERLASDLAALRTAHDETQRALAAERLRAEQAEAATTAQRQRAEQAAARLNALQHQYDLMQGSLRTFLRGYVPRLRRHLFGQRP